MQGENIEYLGWIEKGQQHRDDDLPAEIYFSSMTGKPNQVSFYKKNLLHRIGDHASIVNYHEGKEAIKKFYLYGVRVTDIEFFATHAAAIKYNIPFWVAFCKTIFKLDFEAMTDSVEDFSLLSEMPAEWVIKVIGLNLVDNGGRLTGQDSYEHNEGLPILTLIQYEKDVFKPLVSEGT